MHLYACQFFNKIMKIHDGLTIKNNFRLRRVRIKILTDNAIKCI